MSKQRRKLATGYQGVSWSPERDGYHAIYKFEGKTYSLGYYDTAIAAHRVRQEAEKLHSDAELRAFVRTHRRTAHGSTPLGKLRAAIGLTQDQAAFAMGVHRTTITWWEIGRIGITREHAVALARLYGVTPEEIVAASRAGATDYDK